MGDLLLGGLIGLLILSGLNFIDVTFHIDKHVDGEKTLCIRGKEEQHGQ